MKKGFFFTTLAFLVVLQAGCKRDGFTIEGTLEGGANQTLWLEEIAPEGPMFIDSIHMDDKGHFKYHYNPPYRSLYNLHTTESNYIVTLPANGETLKVTGKYENLSLTYDVEGSPESTLLWQLQQYTNNGSRILYALVDSVNSYESQLTAGTINQTTYDALKKASDSVYHAAFAEQQEYVRHFVEENAGSLSTLIALYKPFNNRALIDPRDPASIEYYNAVLKGLEEKIPDNPHTQHFSISTEHLRNALARQQEPGQ